MSKLQWLLLICRLVTFAAMVVALVAALLAGRWQRQAARARRETARIVAGGPVPPVRRSEQDPREFFIPLTGTDMPRLTWGGNGKPAPIARRMTLPPAGGGYRALPGPTPPRGTPPTPPRPSNGGATTAR